MEITSQLWLDPNDVSSMQIESGSDNYTLGITITTKNGERHFVRHQPPWISVFDLQTKIIKARTQ